MVDPAQSIAPAPWFPTTIFDYFKVQSVKLCTDTTKMATFFGEILPVISRAVDEEDDEEELPQLAR